MMRFLRRLFGSGASAAEWGERGLGHYQRGEYAEAVAAWTEAVRLDPANADTLIDRGWAYSLLHEHDRAIADFTAALRLRPDSEAFNNRGIAHAAKGEHDKALADFTEAIRLRPLGVKAYLNRAQAYAERGENEPWDVRKVQQGKRLCRKPRRSRKLPFHPNSSSFSRLTARPSRF
jgi:tetratricopeptide (TPR) repeat protein